MSARQLSLLHDCSCCPQNEINQNARQCAQTPPPLPLFVSHCCKRIIFKQQKIRLSPLFLRASTSASIFLRPPFFLPLSFMKKNITLISDHKQLRVEQNKLIAHSQSVPTCFSSGQQEKQLSKTPKTNCTSVPHSP